MVDGRGPSLVQSLSPAKPTKPTVPMRKITLLVLLYVGLHINNASATILYFWDANGTAPGCGGATPTGTWSTDAYGWSKDDPAGTGVLGTNPSAASRGDWCQCRRTPLRARPGWRLVRQDGLGAQLCRTRNGSQRRRAPSSRYREPVSLTPASAGLPKPGCNGKCRASSQGGA